MESLKKNIFPKRESVYYLVIIPKPTPSPPGSNEVIDLEVVGRWVLEE